jgi:hypothetical protein
MFCLLAGTVALGWPARSRLWKFVTLALLVAVNAASWAARPDYLTYFNPLAGDPANAYRLFADSALDWGQGLPALRRWLQETHPAEPVYLAYFGADSPEYRGLHLTRIGDGYFRDVSLPAAPPITPGLFVVSSTLLDGDYTAAPGPWTREHEVLYRRLRAVLVSAGNFTPDQARAWDQIRFARLRHYLLGQKPVAQPDLSLLVYRLSAAQLNEALP